MSISALMEDVVPLLRLEFQRKPMHIDLPLAQAPVSLERRVDGKTDRRDRDSSHTISRVAAA